MTMDVSTNCAVCLQSDSELCYQCKAVAYCSEHCKEIDLPSHLMLCGKFRDFSDQPPDDNHYRAIYFSETSDRPRLIWFRFDRMFPAATILRFMLYHPCSGLDFPMGQYLGRTTVAFGEPRTAECNGRDSVYVWHRENYTIDGSPMCQSALQVMIHARRFTEGTDCKWHGPLLVTATRSFIGREEEEAEEGHSGSDTTDEENEDENEEASAQSELADAKDDVEVLPIDIDLAHFRAFIDHTLTSSQE